VAVRELHFPPKTFTGWAVLVCALAVGVVLFTVIGFFVLVIGLAALVVAPFLGGGRRRKPSAPPPESSGRVIDVTEYEVSDDSS